MRLEQLQIWLKWSSELIIVALLLLVIVFWRTFEKVSNTPVKWLCYSFVCALFLAVSDWLLGVYFLTANFPYFIEYLVPVLDYFEISSLTFLSPVSYLTKFVFYGLFFRDVLMDVKWKQWIWISVWILVAFELVQIFAFHTYRIYDSTSSTVKNVYIITGTFLLLYRMYRLEFSSISLDQNPYFWVASGLLIPALIDIFLEFIFQKLHQTDTGSFYKLYIIRNLNQFMGLLFMIISMRFFRNIRFLPKEY